MLISTRVVYAITSSRIDATVKISICGNSIKEGGEDCDDQDFGGESCGTVGYTHGFLGCKNDCTYNNTLCIFVPSPTPTITPSPTPSPMISPQPTQPTSTPGPTATASPSTSTPEIEVSEKTFVETLVQELLPADLKKFDTNGDNTISREELISGISFWVSSWRDTRTGEGEVERCDINTDTVCNLRDFSVILYYYNSI